MSATGVAIEDMSEEERSRHLNRAVVAATIGTAIEWYDFFLYGTVTGLVFAKLYFPSAEPLTGVLQAFAVFAVGFISRPIGAAIFGHFGDKLGRKASLVATLMLMGVATFAIAFVPTYESIGIWGAVILTFLRFVQGIGVGGEWGGSVLLAMEWAKTNKHRGFIASWPQFGAFLGLFLSNLAVLGMSAWSGDAFFDWGWRVPFLFSVVLIGIGLYVRLGIIESPVFTKLKAENKLERTPMLEVIKRQPKEIILSALARTGENASFYIFTAFILAYGTQHLNLERDFLLKAVMAGSLLCFLWIPLFGWLSDRWGRKRVFLMGITGIAVFSFAYFAMLESRVPSWAFLAIVFSLLPHNMAYGPEAAMIAESFTGRLRYSGASLGYQLTAIIAGGPAPLIATALLDKYKSGYAVAYYLLACCVVSFIATLFLKDRTNTSIDSEYDEVRSP